MAVQTSMPWPGIGGMPGFGSEVRAGIGISGVECVECGLNVLAGDVQGVRGRRCLRGVEQPKRGVEIVADGIDRVVGVSGRGLAACGRRAGRRVVAGPRAMGASVCEPTRRLPTEAIVCRANPEEVLTHVHEEVGRVRTL
jgi:hypothetical protein